jgi:hypothetical protein
MDLYDDDALEEYDNDVDRDDLQDEDDDRALDDEGEVFLPSLPNLTAETSTS